MASTSGSRRCVVRFVIGGAASATATAVLPSEADDERPSRGQSTVSASSSPSSGPSQRSKASASTSASSLPRKRSARSSGAGSPSASSASPPLSSPSVLFNRPTPPHPDVSAVRVEDTPLLLPLDEHKGGAGPNGSLSLLVPPSSALLSSSALSSSSLPQSSSSSSSTPSLSSQLLGSVLNVSQTEVSVPVDGHQFPYSGPLLSSARVKSAFPVIIPSSARWFDLDAVSERERAAFPEWLEGREGRSAAVSQWYRTLRNGIVTAYRANPRVYLTITACRRQVAADVGAISRLHLFLQSAGLINYHVDPGSQPLLGSTNKERISYPIFTHTTAAAPPAPAATATANETAASALSHLFAFPSAAPSASAAPSTAPSALPASFRRLLVGPVLGQEAAVSDPRYSLPVGAAAACQSCARPLPDGLRFVGRVDPSVILCPTCFGDGRLPLLMTAEDFVRTGAGGKAASSSSFSSQVAMAAAAAISVGGATPAAGEWKAEETLRLLDGLQLHGEDWEAVADFVGGGKSKGSATAPPQAHFPSPSTPPLTCPLSRLFSPSACSRPDPPHVSAAAPPPTGCLPPLY